ncbi:MAG: GNAT family N-acetyltransferase [Thermoplasmata archaeon]
MDASRYSLRGFRDADYGACAALHNGIFPDHPRTPESLRGEDAALETPSDRYPRYVVEETSSGALVGVGDLEPNPYQEDPLRPWVFAEVRDDRRRKGIGSELLRVLREAAARRGATGLRCSARDDRLDDLAYLRKRGFVERRRSWTSVLDVGAAETVDLPERLQALAHQGIECTSLEREGAEDLSVLRRVHEFSIEGGRDMPRVGPYTPVSFEVFRRLELGGPGFLADAWVLAKEGSRYVGSSVAGRDINRPGSLHQWATMTRPDYRRRGIAWTLKLLVVDYAKRNRYTRIETSNDSENVAMWALNQRLGFRKIGGRVHTELAFEAPASPRG